MKTGGTPFDKFARPLFAVAFAIAATGQLLLVPLRLRRLSSAAQIPARDNTNPAQSVRDPRQTCNSSSSSSVYSLTCLEYNQLE